MAQEKKSGKQATKGQKQILEENVATLKYYRYMILIALAIHGLYCAFIPESMTTSDKVQI